MNNNLLPISKRELSDMIANIMSRPQIDSHPTSNVVTKLTQGANSLTNPAKPIAIVATDLVKPIKEIKNESFNSRISNVNSTGHSSQSNVFVPPKLTNAVSINTYRHNVGLGNGNMHENRATGSDSVHSGKDTVYNSNEDKTPTLSSGLRLSGCNVGTMNIGDISFTLEKGSSIGTINSDKGTVTVPPGAKANDINTKAGKIELLGAVAEKAKADNLSTVNGEISMSHAEIKSLTTRNGSITIKHSSVSEDIINHGTGLLLIADSIVSGKVTTSATNLYVCKNSTINHIYLKNNEQKINRNSIPEPIPKHWEQGGSLTVGPKIGGSVGKGSSTNSKLIIINEPLSRKDDNFSSSSKNNANGLTVNCAAVPQPITLHLEDGVILKELTLDGQECTLFLLDSAIYEGDHDAPGLTVKKVAS